MATGALARSRLPTLDYRDGSAWKTLAAVRLFGGVAHPGPGGSKSDAYSFDEVRASKVRYSFDNCRDTLSGASIRSMPSATQGNESSPSVISRTSRTRTPQAQS